MENLILSSPSLVSVSRDSFQTSLGSIWRKRVEGSPNVLILSSTHSSESSIGQHFSVLNSCFLGVKTGEEDKFSPYPLPLRYLSISESRMSMIPFPSTALEMGKYPKVEGSSMVWKVANTNNYNVLLPIIFFTQVQITPSHMGGIKSRWYPPRDYTVRCRSPWTKTALVGYIVLHEVGWLRVIKKPSHVFINILIKKINNN